MNILPKGNIVGTFSGTSDTVYTFSQPIRGFGISNDGTADLTFTINGITMRVRSEEVFDDQFEWFQTVTILTAVPFRAWGKG